MKLRWIVESGVAPARALAVGSLLAARVSQDDAPPAILYGAGLTGDALVLGRWQRTENAVRHSELDVETTPLLRRTTGGPSTMAGDGIVYLALCLRHASALIDCPHDRVLNRNVRGMLGGLSKGGIGAHYSGRQWLSVDRRPVALVGWDREPDGRVMVELFVSHQRTFAPPPELDAYPKPSEPPFQGKVPVTLQELWSDPVEPEELVRWIAEGHPERFGEELTLERRSLDDDERTRAGDAGARFVVDPGDEDDLSWSAPREVPIGYLSAGVRVADGAIEAAEVAGDFFQDADAPRVLRDKLVGQPPDPETVAGAVNDTWDGNKRVIEGIKELEPIVDALLEAAK